MYVLWFCYLYENLSPDQHYLKSIEDLFLEFKSNILNGGRWPGLAQLYAGCGADRASKKDFEFHRTNLRRYYDTAEELLKNYLPEACSV